VFVLFVVAGWLAVRRFRPAPIAVGAASTVAAR